MAEENEVKKILVIYHADCPDGFGAAYSAWKKFGDSADYLPAFHKTEPPDVTGKDVYTLDYCYPEEIMERIMRQANKVVVIDHHVTNEATTKLATEHVFDNSHSGAVLSWKYFHPGSTVPLFLRYVEDKDLWKFALPESNAASFWLVNLQRDFSVWDRIIADFEDKTIRDSYIAEGRRIETQMMKVVADRVSDAREVLFEGYKTLIIETSVYHSEVGNALAKKLPPIGIVWSEKNGKISVSLRSDGTVDVAKLAQKYGGGGHKAAAGFELATREELKTLFKLS